jgi:hypothetical protein
MRRSDNLEKIKKKGGEAYDQADEKTFCWDEQF